MVSDFWSPFIKPNTITGINGAGLYDARDSSQCRESNQKIR
jgi:hypothetical protein